LRMVILGLCVAARMETHFYEAPDEKLLCWRCIQRQFETR
jgi:hypothetical protein